MIYDVVAVAFGVAVICAPILILSPVIERIFESGSLRAIVRRAFGIDCRATLADVPQRRLLRRP
jgi:hypothetical protein